MSILGSSEAHVGKVEYLEQGRLRIGEQSGAAGLVSQSELDDVDALSTMS